MDTIANITNPADNKVDFITETLCSIRDKQIHDNYQNSFFDKPKELEVTPVWFNHLPDKASNISQIKNCRLYFPNIDSALKDQEYVKIVYDPRVVFPRKLIRLSPLSRGYYKKIVFYPYVSINCNLQDLKSIADLSFACDYYLAKNSIIIWVYSSRGMDDLDLKTSELLKSIQNVYNMSVTGYPDNFDISAEFFYDRPHGFYAPVNLVL